MNAFGIGEQASWVNDERVLLGTQSDGVKLLNKLGETLAGIALSPALVLYGLVEAVRQRKFGPLMLAGGFLLAACGNASGSEPITTDNSDGVILTPTPDSHGGGDWPAQVRYVEPGFDVGSGMAVLQDGGLALETMRSDYPAGIGALEEAGFKVNEMDFYRLNVMDGDVGLEDDIEYVFGYDPASGQLMAGFELDGVNVHTPDAGEPLAGGERWEWARAQVSRLEDGTEVTTIFGGGFEVMRVEPDGSWKLGLPFQSAEGGVVMVEPATGGGKLASPVQWMSELRSDAYNLIQEKIAGSEQFTLAGGRVEMQTETTVITLPGLSINPMTGECRFVGDDGVAVGCSSETITWGTNYFSLSLNNGMTATFDGKEWLFEPVAGSTVMVADGTITVDGTAVAESTATAVYTPEVGGYLDLLNINWSDVFDPTKSEWVTGGMPITVGVDKDSLRGRASGVDYKSDDVLALKAFQMLRALLDPSSGGAVAGTEGFAKQLADLKAGKTVEAGWVNGTRLKIFDANGSGNAEEMWLVPDMGGNNVPAGAYEIKGLEIVYGDWADYSSEDRSTKVDPSAPWFKVITKVAGIGAGVIFDKSTGTLTVFMGLPDSGFAMEGNEDVASVTEMTIDWLAGLAVGNPMSRVGSNQRWVDRGAIWSDNVTVTK